MTTYEEELEEMRKGAEIFRNFQLIKNVATSDDFDNIDKEELIDLIHLKLIQIIKGNV